MKRKLRIISSVSAASILAISALAQDPTKVKAEPPNYPQDPVPHERSAYQLNDAAKASDIVGMPVKNYQNEKLGKVDDLVVDLESGRIVQAILSTGGFIGLGDTLTAVPPGALHHDAANKVLHLDADKEKLKNAPKFEMSKWSECCDASHLSEVYRYYGEEPAFNFLHKGDAVLDGHRRTESAPNTVSTRKADGTWDKDRISTDSQAMIPASRLAQLQKASKLMGTAVKNLQDEKLGKVENLLADLPSGRVIAVIISSGGFLGMGDELSAVPPAALRFTADRDSLQLDTSKDRLSNAPHFKANQWPDFAQPTYSDEVYRAYRVEPYFTTNLTTEADNTGRNVRDRNNRTLTPFDQGKNPRDREITTQIRKEILASKGMSVSGHNVKIVTIDGRVTLRGPVNTPEEKASIEEIATRIANAPNVDNQLEVKTTPTGRN